MSSALNPQMLVEAVRSQLVCGVSLLERLRILAQTERLALDSGDLTELASAVQAKEGLVAEIRQHEQRLVAAQSQLQPFLHTLSPESKASLDAIKKRALQLLDRIGSVEEENRRRLDQLRTAALKSSGSLQQDRKLRAAYSATGSPRSRFTRVAD